jgi:hypothetical protein
MWLPTGCPTLQRRSVRVGVRMGVHSLRWAGQAPADPGAADVCSAVLAAEQERWLSYEVLLYWH